MNDSNPFLNDDQNDQEKNSTPINNGEEVTRISLRDVQNMSFPVEEEKKQVIVPEERQLTAQEINEIRNRRRQGAFKIFKLLRFLIAIIVVVFLFFQYKSYAKNTKQNIVYQFDHQIYEIHRIKNVLSVTHKEEINCEESSCTTEIVAEYPISLEGFSAIVVRSYYDYLFFFHNGEKRITKKDLRTSFSSRSLYSMIHNDPYFLGIKKYRDYSVLAFEQKSDYVIRGYQYIEDKGHFYLSVAMGEKESSGYSMNVFEVHQIEDEMVFYITETSPSSSDKWINMTQPVLNIEINEKPNKIRVINVDSGEEYSIL